VSEHLRYGFIAVFAQGPHCLWYPKSRWSPPFGASVALKINKKKIRGEKIMTLLSKGEKQTGGEKVTAPPPSPPSKGSCFYRKFSIKLLIADF